MRQLILKMSVSVDGFVGGPNGEIDWIFKSYDAGATAWEVDALWQAGVHIMGSRTFQDMAAYWPTSTEPYAAPMNENPEGRLLQERAAAGIDDHRRSRMRSASGRKTRRRRRRPVVLDQSGHRQRRSGRGDCATEATTGKADPGPWRRQLRAQPGAEWPHRRILPAHPSGRAGAWPAAVLGPGEAARSQARARDLRSTAAPSRTSIGRRDPRCRCGATGATSRPAGSSSAAAARRGDRGCGAG